MDNMATIKMIKAVISTAKIFKSPIPILSGFIRGIYFLNVGRVRFELTKAQGQQIYSLPRLTASVSTQKTNA